MVVIDSMFISHFVDPDLRIEIFFEKQGAAKNAAVDFEIGDIDTSAHLYWRLMELSCKVCLLCFFSVFLATKVLLACTKVVPVHLNVKFISKYNNHGFTNRGCLHCATLKGLYGFKGKRACKVRDMQFFLQNVENVIFKVLAKFKKNTIFTRTAC